MNGRALDICRAALARECAIAIYIRSPRLRITSLHNQSDAPVPARSSAPKVKALGRSVRRALVQAGICPMSACPNRELVLISLPLRHPCPVMLPPTTITLASETHGVRVGVYEHIPDRRPCLRPSLLLPLPAPASPCHGSSTHSSLPHHILRLLTLLTPHPAQKRSFTSLPGERDVGEALAHLFELEADFMFRLLCPIFINMGRSGR
ncbi:hypothetical protein C8R45DRAFT_1101178 [Mycena sanguinolenta]|nr:hypothetical protein C8R45DRAFT_1101178 [Mycena sanguinolenta]